MATIQINLNEQDADISAVHAALAVRQITNYADHERFMPYVEVDLLDLGGALGAIHALGYTTDEDEDHA